MTLWPRVIQIWTAISFRVLGQRSRSNMPNCIWMIEPTRTQLQVTMTSQVMDSFLIWKYKIAPSQRSRSLLAFTVTYVHTKLRRFLISRLFQFLHGHTRRQTKNNTLWFAQNSLCAGKKDQVCHIVATQKSRENATIASKLCRKRQN